MIPVPRTLPAEAFSVISRSVIAQQTAPDVPATREVPALHGAMHPGQSVVYVLDTSGSMGEYGKLARARDALIATLRDQPVGVKFQVIVYNSIARPLFPGMSCVAATTANIDAVSARLAAVEPKGRSNHVEALRAAARNRPDVILFLGDVDGPGREQIRAALAQVERPTYICLSGVTARKIEAPLELR